MQPGLASRIVKTGQDTVYRSRGICRCEDLIIVSGRGQEKFLFEIEKITGKKHRLQRDKNNSTSALISIT